MRAATRGPARRAANATWGDPVPPAAERPRMKLLSFKPHVKNTLRGFVDLELGIGLQIPECSLHVKNGRAWVGVPVKPMVDADGRHMVGQTGKKLYRPVLAWRDKRLSDAFDKAVIKLVLEKHPGALDGGAT
jgi:hypothetical protein